ncbi:PP235 [Orf virus]|uniref:PP235 n=1 Tax=Orf virus TaxID=10258 RepID=F1AXB6_ORFV|nr:PP235 [Orf virus]
MDEVEQKPREHDGLQHEDGAQLRLHGHAEVRCQRHTEDEHEHRRVVVGHHLHYAKRHISARDVHEHQHADARGRAGGNRGELPGRGVHQQQCARGSRDGVLVGHGRRGPGTQRPPLSVEEALGKRCARNGHDDGVAI